MPPKNEDDPLSPTEVALIKLWIDQGAKPPAIDTKTIRTVVVDLPPALVKPVRAVAFSTALNLVAAGRGNQIHLFDAKTGEFKKTLLDPDLKTVSGKPAQAAHLSLVEAMAFSPDGSTLISGSFREAVLWDVSKGTIVKRLTGFADRVVTIDFAQDGTLFATGGGAPTEDGEIKIFDKSGKVIKELTGIHSDTVFGLNFSPDGKLLATAGADKFVRVLSLPDGKVVKSFEGHTHHVMDVAWTADGKRIVSAGADNIVKVWDYEKGEKVRDINAAKKQVTRLVMVPKTSQFLTCDGDSDVKMWNADNGGSMRSFTGGKDFMYAVAVSTDGKFVATGGEEGIIRLYSSDAKLIKALYPPGEEPTVPKK
jgi:WD40 repeat protein